MCARAADTTWLIGAFHERCLERLGAERKRGKHSPASVSMRHPTRAYPPDFTDGKLSLALLRSALL